MTNATARPATATTARYTTCWARVWGQHPVLVRATDGLMVPCTHSPARRGEPACPMPRNWRGDGDTRGAWAKPLGADRYDTCGRMTDVTSPDVVAAADAAFAAVDARRARRAAAPARRAAPAVVAPAPTGRAARTILMY